MLLTRGPSCLYPPAEYEDASLSSWVNKERFQGYLQIDGFTLYELGETGGVCLKEPLLLLLLPHLQAVYQRRIIQVTSANIVGLTAWLSLLPAPAEGQLPTHRFLTFFFSRPLLQPATSRGQAGTLITAASVFLSLWWLQMCRADL